MLTFNVKGDWVQTTKWLEKQSRRSLKSILQKYGELGVSALASATPAVSGMTAHSWAYRVVSTGTGASIEWYNNNKINGFSVAIGLQYGHGTRNGGFVRGRDYINPALRGVFEQLSAELWKEVTNG